MRFVSKDDFDFSHAGIYRNVEPLAHDRVRVATTAETIVSRHSSGVETTNQARPGDYIISSPDHGGAYIIAAQRFATIYEHDPLDGRSYRAIGNRAGLLILMDIVFTAPWGAEQNVRAGGVIFAAGDHIYGIDRFSFIRKYGRVDDSRPGCEVFVRMNQDLDSQYAEAEKRGLINHLQDITLRRQNQALFQDQNK